MQLFDDPRRELIVINPKSGELAQTPLSQLFTQEPRYDAVQKIAGDE